MTNSSQWLHLPVTVVIKEVLLHLLTDEAQPVNVRRCLREVAVSRVVPHEVLREEV